MQQEREQPGSSVAGWWYTYPSEKYEFVSWDDEDLPTVSGKIRNDPKHKNQVDLL